ncbi:hypothetical protein [Falsiroseomonas sp. HW251]|uniref:hypothetical protein n=1 Tax=Falsiroseomonas sp. HW251 TaxID=3390998 RepID=UPI003D3202C2
MTTTRKALLGAVLAAATLAAPAAFAQQGTLPAPSSAWVNAVIQGLDAPTRREVESRATGGNHPYEVLRVILLNNMSAANLVQAGQPPLSEIVAIDFIRATAVVRQGDGLRAIPFNRENLTIRR